LGRSRPELPPAIVVGGEANSISVVRSLGALGIKVYALCEPTDHTRYSRFCHWIPLKDQPDFTDRWESFLVGEESEYLRGAVLLATCDAAIEIIARHREALSQKFILDISDTEAQLSMLDKLSTYRQAQKAGVNTPRFWPLSTRQELLALKDELTFPLIIKPLKSHLFRAQFTGKYFRAKGFEELLRAYEKVFDAGLEVMLVEEIPGPDDRLCSYYTYLDENGVPAFHFTKRVIRRFPVGMGLGCYHITDWNPSVMEQSLKLFKTVGLKGLANAEFKRDSRDGLLKLIECNARFTAANGLLAESGLDLAAFVYYRLTGVPYRLAENYRVNRRLWSPIRDFHAYRQLSKRGELTFNKWLRSVIHRQSFLYFKWYDPLPTLKVSSREVGQSILRRINRARLLLRGIWNRAYRKA
jgi:D-aspartate ligase